MPRYSSYGVRPEACWHEYANKDLPSLYAAGDEAKRLGRIWFGTDTADVRIEAWLSMVEPRSPCPSMKTSGPMRSRVSYASV